MELFAASSEQIYYGKELLATPYPPLSWLYKGVFPAITKNYEAAIFQSIAINILSACLWNTSAGGSKMRAVITAGGRGIRVASVNRALPKPMLPINGKPVLLHQVECLRRQNITHITLTIGYWGEQIQKFFEDGSRFGVHIDYIREKAPLGTAGALAYLKGKISEDFLLINGDLIFDIDFARMEAFHKSYRAAATLLVHPNDHPYDSGIVLTGRNGQVTGWLAKEERQLWYHNCVNAGVHILSPSVLERLKTPQKLDLDRELLKPLIPLGKVYAYRSPEYVKDMGTPERIAQVERDLQIGLVERRNLHRRQKAIFLDRDGTVNQYVGFLRRPEDFQLIDGVAAAVRRVNQSGYLAIVVTNQPVIARGEASWEQLDEIHCKMETLLGKDRAYLDDIFICPHHPDSGYPGEIAAYKVPCSCRKPKPGLLLQAAEKYHIDLVQSWMIGDSERDIQAGQAAGCQTIMLTEQFRLLDAIKSIQL